MLLFSILITITCLLLVLVILVQNPKGGGLSSTFGGGGTQMFGGVKKTTDFLDRATWTLAIVLFALVLMVNMIETSPVSAEQEESKLDAVEQTTPSLPQALPNASDEDLQQDLPQSVDEE